MGCEKLSYITVDPNNETYESVTNYLLTKGRKTLVVGSSPLSNDDNHKFPEEVETIGSYSFHSRQINGNFKTWRWYSNVYRIDNNAFEGSNCGPLVDEYLEGVNIIGRDAFKNCSMGTGTINIPESVTVIYGNPFAGAGVYEFTIDSGNKYFYASNGHLIKRGSDPDYGTYDTLIAGGMDSVSSVPSVQAIGSYAFYGATGNVSIPASVIRIGSYAFAAKSYYSGGVDTITFSSSGKLEYIDNCAFYRHYSESITIPKNVKEVGASAFVCGHSEVFTSMTFAITSGWKGLRGESVNVSNPSENAKTFGWSGSATYIERT